MYHADHGHYPNTPSWRGDSQKTNDDFIPGLVPQYISDTPQVEPQGTARPRFVYISSPDGSDYKLIYIVGTVGSSDTLPSSHTSNNPLIDPARKPAHGDAGRLATELINT